MITVMTLKSNLPDTIILFLLVILLFVFLFNLKFFFGSLFEALVRKLGFSTVSKIITGIFVIVSIFMMYKIYLSYIGLNGIIKKEYNLIIHLLMFGILTGGIIKVLMIPKTHRKKIIDYNQTNSSIGKEKNIISTSQTAENSSYPAVAKQNETAKLNFELLEEPLSIDELVIEVLGSGFLPEDLFDLEKVYNDFVDKNWIKGEFSAFKELANYKGTERPSEEKLSWTNTDGKPNRFDDNDGNKITLIQFIETIFTIQNKKYQNNEILMIISNHFFDKNILPGDINNWSTKQNTKPLYLARFKNDLIRILRNNRLN